MNRIKVLRILLVACLGLALVLVIVSLVDRPAAESVTATRTAFAAQAQPASGLPLCFVGDDGTACVQRAGVQSTSSISAQVRALVESMLAGPTAAEQANGVGSALPDGAQLSNLSVADDHVSIDLVLPDAYLKSLTPAQVENVNEQFLTTLTPYNFQRIDVNVRDAQGNFRLLSTFLAPIVIPHKQGQAAPSAQAQASTAGGQPPAAGQPQPRGGLYGKTVFVSAGHGWYWSTSQNQYRTQRPVYPTTPYPSGDGIVEDFNNAEAVDQYLLPYLWNSGADAWTVREQDMNSSMLIVDDKDGFSTQGGWLTGSGGYGGSYRFVWTVAAGATATATWTFTPPTTNTYAVYVWSPEIAATRAVDAHFYVEHAGGVTPVTVSQARDNGNWRYIGSYPFYGGQPGRVWVTNQSNTPGVFVLADAIRIGGGIADTPPPTTLSPSGRPRWEDQAWTYARWVGMPNADNPDPKEMNDVIVRPIYSEWEKDPGEDAVYIAWHTNGYNGYNTVARGTESYIHSFQPTPNSDVLQNYIHTDLLNAIHTGWDAAWPDRGKKTADLGELRLLSTMPGVLIENGYHDNPQDVEAMKDPRFDLLSARAIYHGLVRYWHSRDPNVPLVFLPEPPVHLIARNTGAGEVTLTWQPGPTDGAGLLGDAATSYRVYTSADGFGWSDAIAVPQTTYVLAGLQPGQLVYVRVTGVNAGGESFPTPVMAARADPSGSAAILIVYGFDRIDRYGAIKQYDPPEGYDRRVFADRINAFDYIIQHADAITLPFDSAQRDAVSDGSIGLNGYAVVDWIAGEDQSPQAALSAGDQSALGSFVSGGGALLIGGAKIGSDLQGTSFYANVLHAAFAGSANTHLANAQPGGVWSGLGNLQFDDGTHGTYDVDSPDAFNPIGGATTALVYNGGGPAAIQ